MSADRIAVITVIHPAALPYWPEALADLSAQSDDDFTVIVLCDGVPVGQCAGTHLRIIEATGSGTPAALRAQAIARASELADVLIFADADDRFRPDRVEAVRAAIAGWDALGHDFTPFSSNAQDQPPALHASWDPARPFTAADLLDGTCIGLGASACRTGIACAVAGQIALEADVFDWDFYAMMLHMGAAVRFLDQPLTRYRQHPANLVGWGRSADAATGCRRKAAHYHRLQEWAPAYLRLAPAFLALANRLNCDVEFAAAYAQRPPAPRPGWWYDLILEPGV